MKDLTIEEVQEKFLSVIGQFPLALCSYYVVKVVPPAGGIKDAYDSEDEDEDLRMKFDELESFEATSLGAKNLSMSSGMSVFLQQYKHLDLLCTLNFNGISFFVFLFWVFFFFLFNYEDFLYVFGDKHLVKISFLN